jgi:hypothetical protein
MQQEAPLSSDSGYKSDILSHVDRPNKPCSWALIVVCLPHASTFLSVSREINEPGSWINIYVMVSCISGPANRIMGFLLEKNGATGWAHDISAGEASPRDTQWNIPP